MGCAPCTTAVAHDREIRLNSSARAPHNGPPGRTAPNGQALAAWAVPIAATMQVQRPTSILSGPLTGQPSRRVQPRHALRWPVVIQILGGSERRGVTVDLSSDGLSLSTDRPIAPGSRCTLFLRPAPDNGWLRLDVKSVYSSYSAPGDFRIGMAFSPQDTAGRDQLFAVVAASA
jgi:hypothetical protein